jgi:hypothetical protein
MSNEEWARKSRTIRNQGRWETEQLKPFVVRTSAGLNSYFFLARYDPSPVAESFWEVELPVKNGEPDR